MKIQYINYAFATLMGFASATYATDYTSQILANGTTVTLEDGDTVSYNGLTLLADNAGEIIVDGAIAIDNMGSTAYAVQAKNGSSINLGSGSTVNSVNGRGISVESNSFVYADNLTLFADGVTQNSRVISSGTLHLGTNSTITSSGSNTLQTIATSGGYLYATSGLRLEGKVVVEQIGNTVTDLGTNGYIKGYEGFKLAGNGTVTFDNFTIEAEKNGFCLYGGTLVNISNSKISSKAVALDVYASSNNTYVPDDTATLANFSNTSFHSQTQVINLTQSATSSNNLSKTINFKDGSTLYSESGILLSVNAGQVSGSLTLNFSGKGTVANGRVLDAAERDTTINFADSAVWNVTGQSSLNKLVLDGGEINFTFTADTDKITTRSFEVIDGTVNFGLADDFAALYFHTIDGEFIFALEDTITNSSELPLYGDINIARNSKNYKWEVEFLADNTYRLYNFELIPEPSTYAAMLGAMGLAFAVYRRRK